MKSSLTHLSIALSVCAASFIGYGIGYAALSAKSAEVAALQGQIDTKTETVNRIAATRATLASIANDEAIVQNYFVPETSIVSFINELEAHGKLQGATVSVLSVAKSGTDTQPELAFSLTTTGTFDAILRTVGSIEFMPYNILTSALSVTQEAKDSWRADLKLLVGSTPTNAAGTLSGSNALEPNTP